MQIRRSTEILAYLAAVLIAALAAPYARAHTSRASDPTAAAIVTPGHLYDRIAVIGASVSDGFGVFVSDPANAQAIPSAVNLSDVLRAAAPTTSAPTTAPPTTATPILHHYASGFFFSNPGSVGKSEIDRAIAAKPTLVLAIDFLFWYVYGTVDASGEVMQDDAQRSANLETGFAQLDRLLVNGTPVIIADIPDMSDAIGKMLSANQVPTPAALEAVNARITAWVATRPAVKLMKLRTLLAALKAGGVIEVAGRVWDPTTLGQLLQRDQLHPTFAGTVIIAAGLIDLARANDLSIDPPFVFEIGDVTLRALDAKKSKSAKAKAAAAAASGAAKRSAPTASSPAPQ